MARLPRGPKSALVQLFRLRDPFPAMLAYAREYGDPMSIPLLGQGPIVMTWDPPGIQAIFAEDPQTYAPAMTAALPILGAGSLFLLEGAAHARARKMLAPPFHGERMRAYGALMRDVTLRYTARWEPGRRFAVIDTTQAITLDVIIEAIFGVQRPDRVESLHRDIVDTIASFHPFLTLRPFQRSPFGLGPWARFLGRRKALCDQMLALIAAVRASPEGREDILSLLVAARDDEGRGLSDQDITDQLLSLVLAGHETTASSLAWALYRLHRSQGALARLQADLSPFEKDLDPAAIARLPYLEAVCQETLRLYPVLPIVTRKLRRPMSLKGHDLPEGTTVGAAAYLAHQREEVFPDPAEFRPERFLGKTYSPFEYLPFGGGARRCLGAAFATYEMKIVLATIIARHRLSLAEERPVKAILRAATMGPQGGVHMVLEERR